MYLRVPIAFKIKTSKQCTIILQNVVKQNFIRNTTYIRVDLSKVCADNRNRTITRSPEGAWTVTNP